MAEPRAGYLHQHFALARRVEVDLLDLQRPAVGVGTRQALLVEHGGFHLHGCAWLLIVRRSRPR